MTELLYVYKAHYEPGTKIVMHRHSCTEVVLYISAAGKTKIGENEYSINSGDIAVIHAETPHDEHHGATADVIFFAYKSDKNLTPPEGVFKVSTFEKLRSLVSMMYSEIRSSNSLCDVMTRAIAEQTVVLFERSISDNSRDELSLEYFANFIKENCSSSIDLKKLTKDYGIDYDRFRREFKNRFGLAPKQYIINSRLLLSHSLLSDTDLSCTEICMRCGFSDSSQFSKMFRKRFGISPSKLRKNI